MLRAKMSKTENKQHFFSFTASFSRKQTVFVFRQKLRDALDEFLNSILSEIRERLTKKFFKVKRFSLIFGTLDKLTFCQLSLFFSLASGISESQARLMNF